MPLSNWTVLSSGAPAIGIMTELTSPTPISPILNSGSLRIQQFSVSDAFVHLYNTTYAERGLLKGRLRGIFHPLVIAGATHYSAGFVFMQSQLNLTGGTGSAYFAHLTVDAASANATFIIRKFVGTGLRANLLATTTLYTGSSHGSIAAQNVCLEVEWDASDGLNCIITLWYALNTSDFSALVEETTVTDAAAPLVVSVAEGLGFTNGITSGATDWLVDRTRLMKLL